jgi:hypothetical protein
MNEYQSVAAVCRCKLLNFDTLCRRTEISSVLCLLEMCCVQGLTHLVC